MDRKTWIAREDVAYPSGSQTRPGVAYLAGTQYLVRFRAGIPDTYFTIPAHCRIKGRYVAGHVAMDGEDLRFWPVKW